MEGSEVLRDKHGNRIGEIQTSGAKQILRDNMATGLVSTTRTPTGREPITEIPWAAETC